jgi:DNA-binding transcriptional regulator YiaG
MAQEFDIQGLRWLISSIERVVEKGDREQAVDELSQLEHQLTQLEWEIDGLLIQTQLSRGEKIERLRNKLKLTQQGVAELTDMSVRSVGRAEQDNASDEIFKAIERHLAILLSECDSNKIE